MFNTRLKRLREWRNITQKELGQSLNFSQQTIYKWETGSSTPDPDTLIKIAQALRVSLDNLLGQTMITEDNAPYQDAETYLSTLSQSDAFLSLFNVDTSVSQEQLNSLSHQLYQMTKILYEPYQIK